MARKKKAPDPRMYATTSMPSKAKVNELAVVPVPEVAAPGCERRALPQSAASLTAAVLPSSSSSTPPPPLLSMSSPPQLAENWLERPPRSEKELSKRMLEVETMIGVVASVHLEKVSMRSGEHAEVGRTVYSWIFDSHHIVMGDMNCEWRNMIGGAPVDYGRGLKCTEPMEAWVKPTSHSAAIRPGGTYLPGVRVEKTPRYKGDKVSTDPPTFDLVVVTKPLSVELLGKQLGKSFPSTKLPRTLIHKLPPGGWPSDHTSVIATVKGINGAHELTVATWNVADPWYFGKFWRDASFGFGLGEGLNTFDQPTETARLRAIEAHIGQLLAVADVLGLQEVPSALVHALICQGVKSDCNVQWVAAPSDKDEKWYDKVAGNKCCSSREDDMASSSSLPPVAHGMLFTRLAVMKAQIPKVSHQITPSTVFVDPA